MIENVLQCFYRTENLIKEDIKMSEVKKDKSVTMRLTEEVYEKFMNFIRVKSEEIGTKLTQAQAFELLVREIDTK